MNWPSYMSRRRSRELWKEAGILPEENALVGEDFGWELSKLTAHAEAGQKRREDERGPVMEAMVDSARRGAKCTKSPRTGCRSRQRKGREGKTVGTRYARRHHLLEEDEARVLICPRAVADASSREKVYLSSSGVASR